MAELIARFKSLIAVLAPFVLLDVYLQHYYSVHLHQMVLWWAGNWRLLEHFWFITFWSLLTLIFSAMLVTGMLIRTYLLVLGEDHRLIYAGNVNAHMAEYYFADHSHQPPVVASSTAHYNTSFKTLYGVDHFRKDPGTRRAGIPIKDYHPFSILSRLCLTIALFSILIPLLHIYAYPPELGAGADNPLDSREGLDQFLGQWGLSMGHLLFAMFSGFIVGMIFKPLAPHQPEESSIQPLPGAIRPGARIRGLPISQEIVRRSGRKDSHDAHRIVDTGYRYAVFRFADGFQMPANVTLHYHQNQHPNWEQTIEEAIKSQRPLQLEIIEDLGIKLAI